MVKVDDLFVSGLLAAGDRSEQEEMYDKCSKKELFELVGKLLDRCDSALESTVAFDNSEPVLTKLASLEAKVEQLVKQAPESKPAMVGGSTSHLPSTQVNPLKGIRISGVPESTAVSAIARLDDDMAHVKEMLKHLGEEYEVIDDCYRLGKFKTPESGTATNAAPARQRTVLVKFRSEWAVRKLMSKAYLLKDYGTTPLFISKDLSQEDAVREMNLLKKRRELINNGTDRKNLKVRGLKLLLNGEEVKYD